MRNSPIDHHTKSRPKYIYKHVMTSQTLLTFRLSFLHASHDGWEAKTASFMLQKGIEVLEASSADTLSAL